MNHSLDELRFYQKKIDRLEAKIKDYCREHFPKEHRLLMEIPGIKEIGAAIILGEIGPNVDAFLTAGHLASWSGLAPDSYESAGIKKSFRITKGNKYIRTALISAGGIAGRSRDPAFSHLYY